MNERKLTKLIQSYGNISANGARKFLCGERLGAGVSREVFVLKQDPSWVVKLQHNEDFANVKEWLLWQEVKAFTACSQWFAPCLVINLVGTVLIQKRAEIGRHRDYPHRIPKFFTDLKLQNFGFIGDQFVCFDYGSCVYLSMLIDTKKGELTQLRTARWWNVEKNRK